MSSSDDDDVPIAQLRRRRLAAAKQKEAQKSAPKAEPPSDSDGSADRPQKVQWRRMKRPRMAVSDSDSDGDTPLSSLGPAVKIEPATPLAPKPKPQKPAPAPAAPKPKAAPKKEPKTEPAEPIVEVAPPKPKPKPTPTPTPKAATPNKRRRAAEESSESEFSASESSGSDSEESYSDASASEEEEFAAAAATPKRRRRSSAADQKKKTPAKQKQKPKPKTPRKKRAKRKGDDDEEDDEDYSSDEGGNGSDEEEGASEEVGAKKGSVRWKTLRHNGPVFAPLYEPHGVPLIYDGEEIVLPPEIEEAASFFARYAKSDHAEKPQFCENFWRDFRTLLKECGSKDAVAKKLARLLVDFRKADFSKIAVHLAAESERKKTKTAAERKRQKEEKEAQMRKFGFAVVDGKEQRIANFIIEPPGLFLGRGDHPKTGMIKKRIWPEDVTLNLGEGEPVPKCPVPGHKWGAIVHNNRATWLASWHESIRDHNKYVWLHASSTIKGSADRLKYETARKLKAKIGEIRTAYTRDLQAEDRLTRQRATAIYLIDKLALRVGGEKGEDEADTVGCCSLRVEHISFPKDRESERIVEFDFLGKDSMRYQNAVAVSAAVYRNLRSFSAKKKPDEKLFDSLSTSDLNDYLKGFMAGLTAKVFRTYNASFTLQQELSKIPEGFADLSAEQKLLFYNRANKQVAILCNHQKTVKQSVFSSAIGGLKELLVELVKQRRLLKEQIEKLGGRRKAKKTAPKKRKEKKASDSDEEEDDDDDDDDASKKGKGRKKKKKADETEEQAAQIDEEAIESDDSDIELFRKTREERLKVKLEREKRIKEIEAAEAAASQQEEKKKKKGKKEDEDEEDEPETKRKKKGKKKKKEEEEEEDEAGEEAEKAKKEFKVPSSLESCEAQLERVNERIAKIKLKMVEKNELRNVALGTSKLNYMDPRITVAWCRRVGLKLDRVFQKSLRDKFTWAISEIDDEVEKKHEFVW